jgi:hypothetical protein
MRLDVGGELTGQGLCFWNDLHAKLLQRFRHGQQSSKLFGF